jgi:hypothetical protein
MHMYSMQLNIVIEQDYASHARQELAVPRGQEQERRTPPQSTEYEFNPRQECAHQPSLTITY